MTKIANEYILDEILEIGVASYYSYDVKTGVEYCSGTLETYELTQASDQEDIVGGRDGNVLATINKPKTLELKISDPFFRADLESAKFGSAIKNVGVELVDAHHMPRNYTVNAVADKMIITLESTPNPGEEVMIYNPLTNKLIPKGEAVITDKKVEISTTDIKAGDVLYVTGYKTKAKATDKFSRITSDSNAPSLYTVIEVDGFDANTMMPIYKKQYIFPKTSLSLATTKSGNTEKTKAITESTLKILKDKNYKDLGTIVYIYPEAEGAIAQSPIEEVKVVSKK